MANTLVVLVKAGNGLLDQIANAIVVGDQRQPVNAAFRQRRHGHRRDNRRLRSQLWRTGFQLARRRVHHRHRIFHGDRLASRLLNIEFGSAKARQDKGLIGHQKMRAIQLGANMHAQIQPPHRRKSPFAIRHSHREVPAKAEQRFRFAVDHRL